VISQDISLALIQILKNIELFLELLRLRPKIQLMMDVKFELNKLLY